MRDVTNIPASRLMIPKHFGRRPDAVFRPAANAEEVTLTQAARIQHAAAVATLDELARRNVSLDWLADYLRQNSDQLRRKLYGQVPAGLRDLCAWSTALNIQTVAPAPAPTPELWASSRCRGMCDGAG